MKNVVVLILAAFLAFSFGACRKKQVDSIRGNMTRGTWKITRFSDNDVEKTFKYSGDTYAFQSSSIVAVNGEHTLNGSWNVENGRGLFRRSVRFGLVLGDPLTDLSGGWEVESFSGTRLELKKDDSGAGEDRLIFEQN